MKTIALLFALFCVHNIFALSNTNCINFLNPNIEHIDLKINVNHKYIKIGKTVSKNPFSLFENKSLVKEKIVSVITIVLTGPLGGHRLYLGTKPIVPIVYALTLGGGFGILPLIDLIYIITTKDIEKLENNDKIFMWIEN